jgi:hypothetical protein
MLARGRSQTDSAQQGFFLAEFPDKSRVVYIKEKDARFPLQFGRYANAQLLAITHLWQTWRVHECSIAAKLRV